MFYFKDLYPPLPPPRPFPLSFCHIGVQIVRKQMTRPLSVTLETAMRKKIENFPLCCWVSSNQLDTDDSYFIFSTFVH